MDKQYQHQNYGSFEPPQGQPQNEAPSPYSGTPSSGYIASTSAPPPGFNAAPQQVYVTQTTVTRPKDPTGLRTAIPELPMALAITYCVVNCVLPGIGTILAGFSVLWCGNVGQSGGGRFGTFCINFWVGIAQLALLIFFIGWIWSIMWGIAFIAISAEAQRRETYQTSTVITTSTVPPVVLPQQQPPYMEKPTPFYGQPSQAQPASQ